jgi:hypothetical protein
MQAHSCIKHTRLEAANRPRASRACGTGNTRHATAGRQRAAAAAAAQQSEEQVQQHQQEYQSQQQQQQQQPPPPQHLTCRRCFQRFSAHANSSCSCRFHPALFTGGEVAKVRV